MKKKIILALTACLFAAGTIINMHLAQSDHNMDVSLADISVMAQAGGEWPPDLSKYWVNYYNCWVNGNYLGVRIRCLPDGPENCSPTSCP